MNKNRTVEVRVNFDLNTITVVETSVEELFHYPNTGKLRKTGLFRIDGDSGGFSRLELTDGRIYKRNYLRKDHSDHKLVDSELLNKKEARELIKSLVKEKIEN